MIAFLMVGRIHVLSAREPDGLHIGEKHPVEEKTVVPVDEKLDAIAQCKGRPEVVSSCEFHQTQHQQEYKK